MGKTLAINFQVQIKGRDQIYSQSVSDWKEHLLWRNHRAPDVTAWDISAVYPQNWFQVKCQTTVAPDVTAQYNFLTGVYT
jgi:hypothetical protein